MEHEMAGWHHQLNGHEFEQAHGVGDGTGKPEMLQSMVLQRVRRDWVTELSTEHWIKIALTGWTFFGKVMSLLFNMLSRLFTAFLPRSKRLFILWLQSPSAVILEPKI